MKMTIYIALISFSILSACKKDIEPEMPLDATEVSFKVSGFNEEVVPLSKDVAGISSTTDTLRKYTDTLLYFVYNNSGALVKKGTQSKSDASYGTVKEKLPPGSYNIYFVLGKGSLLSADESNSGTANIRPASGTWNDLFSGSVFFTVGSAPLQQTVNVQRRVGAIQLELTDTIPANASYITITPTNDIPRMSVSANPHTTGATTHTFSLLPHTGKTNIKFFLCTFYQSGGALDIKAYDAAGQVIAHKNVSIRVSSNHVTYVTGKLFVPNNLALDVTVDPLWKTPRTPIFF